MDLVHWANCKGHYWLNRAWRPIFQRNDKIVNLNFSLPCGYFKTIWHWRLLLVIWLLAHKKPKKMGWIWQLALKQETLVAKTGRSICVTIAQLWRPTARVFIYYGSCRLLWVYRKDSKFFLPISPKIKPRRRYILCQVDFLHLFGSYSFTIGSFYDGHAKNVEERW